MSFKLAIIDDDQEDIERIKKLVGDEMECTCFQDVKVFDTKIYYDALFLDIDMPEKSGLELAREYRALHPHTCIVFITNHNELVYKAINTHPFDFIRKENLEKEMPLVLKELKRELTPHHTVSFVIKGATYIINEEDIYYCESFNHITIVHLKDSELRVNSQLKSIISKLTSPYFMRTGRSYYVNLKHVTALENQELILHQIHIPISRYHKKAILERLKEVNHAF